MADDAFKQDVETEKIEKDEQVEEAKEPAKEGEATTDWLSAGTSWGTNWLKTAKQKTFQTLELVKKDLTEIKDVIGTEVNGLTTAAKDGLETVGAQMKQQAQLLEKMVSPDEGEGEVNDQEEGTMADKEVTHSNSMGFGWMKSFVDTVKNFTVEDTTEGESDITEVIRPRCLRRTNLPEDLLQRIQEDSKTFLEPPEDIVTFNGWMRKFNMTEHDGEINLLLSTSTILEKRFSELVPEKVDNDTFWTRYFFKVEIAEIDEEMKHTLKDLKIDSDQKDKLKENDSASNLTRKSEPVSGTRSADDWSLCDKEEHDIEELTSNGEDTEREDELVDGEENRGALTPKPVEEKIQESKTDELAGKDETSWEEWEDANEKA